MIKIVKAGPEHVSRVAVLFDLYRQFYECVADVELAERYIKARIENDEADIFLALEDENACGFVQLYPSFCSIDASRIFILHDLFVEAGHRRSGIAEKLMNTATDWATQHSASRLDLLTDKTNLPGQTLYEKLGYQRAWESLYAYSLKLPSA